MPKPRSAGSLGPARAALGEMEAWLRPGTCGTFRRISPLEHLVHQLRHGSGCRGRSERPAVAAFFDELRLNGFIEGQNLLVIPGGFGVRNDQIESIVASLVALSPDVIRAGPELPLRALQRVTRTIPLIGMTEDMVRAGLVASLARPGGNITGLSLLSPDLDGKRQETLIEAVPGVRKIAILADSNVTEPAHLQELQEAAHGRGIEALVRGVAKRDDVFSAIDDVKAAGAHAQFLGVADVFHQCRRLYPARHDAAPANHLSVARRRGGRSPHCVWSELPGNVS
jgi:hypothetical protein